MQPHSLWPQGCFIFGLAAPRISNRQPIRLVLLGARKEILLLLSLSLSVKFGQVLCHWPRTQASWCHSPAPTHNSLAFSTPNKTPKRPQRCPQAQPQTGAHMLTSPKNCPQAQGRAPATALPEDARNTDAHKPKKKPATPTSARRPKQTAQNSPQVPTRKDSRIKTTTPRKMRPQAQEHRPQRPARHVSIWEAQF